MAEPSCRTIFAERYRIIQEQFTLQSRDLDNMTQRNRQLYDDQARHDIERGRIMDELAMAKGDLDQLRNEAANLRAEKKIWEVSHTAVSFWIRC